MTITEKIKKYGLTSKDWFQHAHYTIITRMGIDKIQAFEKITINFEAIKTESDFCVIKATGKKDNLTVETFGSAKYGGKVQNATTKKWEAIGNTTTWYVMEMAEKRAMSRVVLKITGFYELGVFGEDESEDFKPTAEPIKPTVKTKPKTAEDKINDCKSLEDLKTTFASLTSEEKIKVGMLKDKLKLTFK